MEATSYQLADQADSSRKFGSFQVVMEVAYWSKWPRLRWLIIIVGIVDRIFTYQFSRGLLFLDVIWFHFPFLIWK